MFCRNKGREKKQKIVVAMSGGVDSSVAAALLKKQGYNVIGAFMRFWSEPQSGSPLIRADQYVDSRGYENRCCTLESETRARKVAKILNIPFYVFNFEKEFKRKIVDYFLAGHKKGITPNPCVVCNKEIKFGLLLEKALKLNADFIATGHYAKIRKFANHSSYSYGLGPAPVYRGGGSQQIRYSLIPAKDKNKDQSYFLWQLSQDQLKRILFPIGDYKREEVEKLAKKFKLPFSGVKKSQEICFIPKSVEDFLKFYFKPRKGKITAKEGKIIGEHQGLWLYTIGQRKGIKLPGGPYYVLGKDFKKNILIVTKKEKDLFKKELIVKNVNWISGMRPKFPLKVKVKIRYRYKSVGAQLTQIDRDAKTDSDRLLKAEFARPQRAITPGQSAVFYGKGEELLGGGIIL